MAEQLPLNRFRLLPVSLVSGSNLIYKEDLDVSTIILSCQITNVTTSSIQNASIQVQKSGSATLFTILNNGFIPPFESLNPLSGKLVLERNDAFYISTDQTGKLTAVLSVLENANS
jgi:hypothetical protein